MNAKPDKWFAVSVTVRPEYTDAVEFAFNNLDSLGSEMDLPAKPDGESRTVTGYFSSRPDPRSIRSELKNAARIHGLPDEFNFDLQESVVEDRDWLAEWKKHWEPVEIGRFVIAAPWHEIENAGKTVVRIEPNMAFGTGTHETTQLCIAAIDENYQPSMSFLDVGTGTGILAIAAAMISSGSVRIEAVDTDADAIAIARTNAELNGVGKRVEFTVGSVETVEGRFDLVCANLTADVIAAILGTLIDRTGSKLVLSGILAEQEEIVLGKLPKNLKFAVSKSGEWMAAIIETGR